jgi:hypothetical protein
MAAKGFGGFLDRRVGLSNGLKALQVRSNVAQAKPPRIALLNKTGKCAGPEGQTHRTNFNR